MARDGGTQHSIKSVPQFLREILGLAKRWDIEDLWFRGHPDVDFLLTPKIYRRSYDEYELKVDFQRRAPQCVNESRPSDDWERYFFDAALWRSHEASRLDRCSSLSALFRGQRGYVSTK